jgi:Tol biopolymer transport system component
MLYPPESMVRRLLKPGTAGAVGATRMVGDQVVPKETTLLTPQDPTAPDTATAAQTPTTSTNEHPFWTADEHYIYFDSNRASAVPYGPVTAGSPTGGPYNIWRCFPDGSGVSLASASLSTTASNLEPAVSQDGTLLAYVSGDTSGMTFNSKTGELVGTNGFELYVVSLLGGTPLLLTPSPNNLHVVFTDVQHPTWFPGGSEIAFSARTNTDNNYHIYVVDTNSGVVRQLTSGTTSETSPAWSPDGNLIAFTSNAASYSGNGPTKGQGSTPLNIWVITPASTLADAHQVTGANFPTKNSKNASWSTIRPDSKGHVTSQLLAFASDRNSTNGTTDIFWMQTQIGLDPATPGAYTVTKPESAGNVPLLLQTSGPTPATSATNTGTGGGGIGTSPVNYPYSQFDPNHTSDEDFPVWPQFISTYRLAFQSNKLSTSTTGSVNLWSTTIIDIDAPTLLQYDPANNQIVGTLLDSSALSETTYQFSQIQRQFNPGDTVRFRVRAADYQTGIKDIFIQVKDPNGQLTSADGLEHKIYFPELGVFDGSATSITAAVNAPFEIDCQAINPNTYQFRAPSTGGFLPAGWPTPNMYQADSSDIFAWSGSSNPPDTDFWIELYDDGPAVDAKGNPTGGHEPKGEVAGDGIYTAIWHTPANLPSDWYIDVIVRDNSINPFDTTESINWKIYDNVWGFTTQPFAKTSNLLYVNDYDIGQRFLLGLTSLSALGSSQIFNVPTESWMTEFEAPADNQLGATPGVIMPGRVVSGTSGGVLAHFENTLGKFSYIDSLNVDANGIPQSGLYDQWRVLCRGPIPQDTLNSYGAKSITDVNDIYNKGASLTKTVAESCVIWHSPYSGDLFVGPGTIIDPNVQQQLTNFVGAGGRLFVSGEDVAWALSLAIPGAPNNFLNNVLKANYVQDFVPDNIITATGTTRGQYPIAVESWYDSFGYITVHPDFIAPPNTNPPYDPPSSGSIYVFTPISGNPFREWGADNQDSADWISFNATPAKDLAQVDWQWPAAANSPATQWFTNAADPSKISKMVYAPFGYEAINPEFFTTSAGSITTYHLKNRRTEIVHNILDYLRTGRIIGTVRSVQGGAPVGNTYIRAVDRNFNTAAFTYTLGDGTYTLSGLDANQLYEIDAIKPGFLAQHLVAVPFHGGYYSELDIFMTPAQNGSIAGTVTVLGTGLPVSNVTVQAQDPTNSALVYTAVTDSHGNYLIQGVPTLTTTSSSGTTTIIGYIVTIPNPSQYGFSGTLPPGYGTTVPGSQPAVQVNNAQAVTGINFQMTPLPGRILGTITDSKTGKGIAGASVTATTVDGSLTYPAVTTDANGNYTIPNVAPGTYNVNATAAGYAPGQATNIKVATKTDTTGVNIALVPVPPGIVAGRVQTATGAAVSGATVTIVNAATNAVLGTTTTTGETSPPGGNNYSVANIPAGITINVLAQKTGYTDNATGKTVAEADAILVQSAGVSGQGPITQVPALELDPLHVYFNTLSLVSAPYPYTTPTPVLVGASADVASGAFTFSTWNGTNYTFYPNPPADSFHRGVGYFLGDTDANQTLAVITYPAAPGGGDPAAYYTSQAYLAQPFNITLQPGWNLIGDPFPFSLNLLNLSVQVSSGTGGTYDIPTAQAQGLVGAALWTYGVGEYSVSYTLDPWQGYWFWAKQQMTLMVSPSAQQQRGIRDTRAVLTAGNTTSDGWRLNLGVTAGQVHGAPGMLGVDRSATDGFDRFKLTSPPSATKQTVQLAVAHTDWGAHSGNYSGDIRSIANMSPSWNFTVTSNVANTPVTLSWPNLATVPARVDLILTDLDSNKTITLRNQSSYTIPAGGTSLTRHFQLSAQPATRQNLQLVSVQAQLNNAGTGRAIASSASISYTLTANATVNVSILQNGRKIRTLESGSTRAAGAIQSIWDLKDDNNRSVSSDTYTVEVRAIDQTGHTVRQVTPLVIPR